ncbi:MAG: hypothetical protein WCZ20_01290 [Hydrogenophaga sp.]|nr:hypothetical protein [Ottowia sp.]
MSWLTVSFTRAPRMPAPEPLPEIMEAPRDAFLAGWWGGICTGCVIGGGLVVMWLSATGRL